MTLKDFLNIFTVSDPQGGRRLKVTTDGGVDILNDALTLSDPNGGRAIKVQIEEGGYKVYTALLTQEDANDPSANVLKNTIGDIVWTRVGDGEYIGTLSGAFPIDKYFAPMPIAGLDSDVNSGGGNSTYSYYRVDDDNVYVVSTQFEVGQSDNVLNNSPIEIRVYD